MRIYPPSKIAEFVGVPGDLTKAECVSLVNRLEADDPSIRFTLVRDEHWMPTVRRFTLCIHRDDRERAGPILRAVGEVSSSPPAGSWRLRTDPRLAACVRQYVRAHDANDALAVQVAEYDLILNLGWLVENLFAEEPLRDSSDLWLDGIIERSITIRPPFGVTILGEVYCGRASDYTVDRVPFAAELETSAGALSLDRFVVRFGRLDDLIAERILQPSLPEMRVGSENEYRLRFGVAHAYFDGPPLIWAIEIAKGANGS